MASSTAIPTASHKERWNSARRSGSHSHLRTRNQMPATASSPRESPCAESIHEVSAVMSWPVAPFHLCRYWSW